MKAGLVSITFRDLSPAEIVREVAEVGLGGIEWGGDVHVPHGDLERARKVGQMTRDAGLVVVSYGSYYAFSECDPDSAPGPSIDSVLETAEALGAPAVRLWAGRRSPDETPPDMRDAIVERARSIAEEAKRRNLRLDFEFHAKSLTEDPASTVDLLQRIAHPSVRTLWQPPLITSPAARLQGLRTVLSWVSNVHCNHFGSNPWPHVLALEEGKDEWVRYLSTLSEPGDDRWVLIEHVRNESLPAFREDAAALLWWLEAL